MYDIYDRFRNVEEKFDLFALKINGMEIWNFVRTEVMRILSSKIENLVLQPTGSRVNSKKETFIHKVYKNPYMVGKKQFLFIGLGRRIYDGKYFEDPVLSNLLEIVNGKYYLFEQVYNGYHDEPVKERSVKYCERYKKEKKNDDRYNKIIRENNDFIVEIFEKEFELNWTNEEKQRLCKLIHYCVTECNVNYRRFCETILERVCPKILFVVNAPSVLNMIWVQEAKRRNIITIEIAHGMMDKKNVAYNFLKERKMSNYPDYIWVNGKYDKEIAAYPIPKSYVIPIGNLWLESKKMTLEKKASKKINITFFGDANRVLEKYIVSLYHSLDQSQYRIIFKLHPHQYVGWEKIYQEISKLDIDVIGNEESSYQCIVDADYIIGIGTTILYEATFFEKRIGVIKDGNYEFAEDLYINGHALLLGSKTQLLDFVTAKMAFVPKKAEYFEKNASQNIQEEIERLLNNGCSITNF